MRKVRCLQKRQRLRWVGAAVLTALALTAAPALTQQSFDITPEEERLVELTNRARSDAGLAPLRTAPELMRSAEIKARDMEERNYFSHYSPEGTSPFTLMRQSGADFTAAGENLAQGASVDRIFASWMKSPDHKKNILGRDFTHLGIGVVTGQGGRLTAVQHFARLRTVTKDYQPPPAPSPAPEPAPTRPAPTAPAPTPAPAPAPAPTPTAGPGTYVVRPGDTLYLIGQRFNVPVWRLILENGWDVLGELRPGQVMRIPAAGQ